MKHNLHKAIAATAASLAVLALFPMQNTVTGPAAPLTASATLLSSTVTVKVNSSVTLTFTLNNEDNTCQLTKSQITKAGSIFEIPDTVTKDGKVYTVTSIGPNAFRGNTNLRRISGGAKHITRIESGAFMGCSNLLDVYLFNGTYPDGNLKGTVEYIGDSAFKDCTSLLDSHFLQSAKYIGAWAFWGSGIPSVFIRDPYSIGEAAFYNCTNISSITIEGSHLKSLPDFAFYNCKNAGSIKLNKSLKEIGKSAFANCDKVETLSLPASVKKIDTGAFMECDKLREVITVNVDVIKDHAFFNCPSMIRFRSSYKDTALGKYSLGYTYTNKLEQNPGFCIKAPKGGAVEVYANTNGFPIA
jgi:hypothetical protein